MIFSWIEGGDGNAKILFIQKPDVILRLKIKLPLIRSALV